MKERKKMEGKRWKFTLSRNGLKWIALISMVCDHTAFCFLDRNGAYRNLYLFLRTFGRIAFPVFCFLLVQGFLSTRNLKQYLLRLFVFGCLSEVPFDLMVYHKVFSLRGQNVMFTLFLALLVLYGLSAVQGSKLLSILLIFLGSSLAVFLKTDYTCLGILFACVMYVKKDDRFFQTAFLLLLMGVQGDLNFWEILSLPLFLLYDAEAGAEKHEKASKAKRVFSKYFFYFFYPLHILFLVFLRKMLLYW